MAEFIVNATLIAAMLVLLAALGITSLRRRRHDRRRYEQDRRVILQTLRGAAAPAEQPTRGEATPTAAVEPAAPTAATGQLDAAAIAALLDLLEDHTPRRRGMIAGLLTSPRTVWTVASAAGQRIGQQGMAERGREPHRTELYR